MRKMYAGRQVIGEPASIDYTDLVIESV